VIESLSQTFSRISLQHVISIVSLEREKKREINIHREKN
jgi:hypothetical protein